MKGASPWASKQGRQLSALPPHKKGLPQGKARSCLKKGYQITNHCKHMLSKAHRQITIHMQGKKFPKVNPDFQGKNHCAHKGTQQSPQENQFCLLSVQQMQTLLILFSKPFSYFPQGTCLLSAPKIYFPLQGIYHPLCIPRPRRGTRQKYTGHGGRQMTKRNPPPIDPFFQ
eukprot:UN2090